MNEERKLLKTAGRLRARERESVLEGFPGRPDSGPRSLGLGWVCAIKIERKKSRESMSKELR